MIRNETICAISTPAGSGGIAVIRLSGNEAITICEHIFYPANKKIKLSETESHKTIYGFIRDGIRQIDDVLLSLFKAPHSFTGEDTVEISCHGSLYIQQQIIQLLIKKGAKAAIPGEFTMRAFMNGKMDLSQAEAVADLIASTSEAAHRVAMRQMRGGFSDEIKILRSQLLHFASLVELELDFSEEDVEFANRTELSQLINNIKVSVERLAQSFELGNAIKNGIPVAIVGEPNVGKSTLLNAMLNEEKAIVSEIAGTTRDAIEDTTILKGIMFRFIDTAGLRETIDVIENLGIKRTKEKMNQAAVIILMIDAADMSAEKKVLDIKQQYEKSGTHLIVAVNKVDRYPECETQFKSVENIVPVVYISAKQKINLSALADLLLETVNYSSLSQNDIIVTNSRHFEALTHALESIARVVEGLESEISGDFLAQDIREVLHHLGSITGEISTDELLGNIFKNFCIGK